MASNKLTWGIVSFLVFATLAISYGLPVKGQGYSSLMVQTTPTPTPPLIDNRDLSKYGIIDFDNNRLMSGSEREKRQKISQRYDNQEWVSQNMNNPEIGGIGRIQELPPPPLFPYEESSLVIVGEVVRAESFLSNDKQGVYTELTIRVDETLNDSCRSKKEEVVADRGGGVVRYPNGQRVLYQSSEQGLPKVGLQYIFFLANDNISPNYSILRSYEFSNGKVLELEPGQPFDEFKNLDKTTFLNTVRRRSSKIPQENK